MVARRLQPYPTQERLFRTGDTLKPTMLLRRILFSLALSIGSLAFGQQYTISTAAGGAPPPTPVVARNTSIGQPVRATLDGAGNLYFSSSNCVFKMDTNGVLTLIAGTSRVGFTGDGGPASSAQLNNPQGVAVDASGAVYIADSANNRVRVVSPAGIITTFAGDGTVGYADADAATDGQLHTPTGLAIDKSGNLYIADSGNSVVRQVSTTGAITTVAGSSAVGYFGDGGPATSAYLVGPLDVAVDGSGDLFIADTGNAVIRKVTPDGNINTVAGSNIVGFSGDGGKATSAELNQPRGVAVDSSGNIYIAEYGDSRIRNVSNGTISTIAGTGVIGFSGDGSQSAKAQLASPWSVCVDSGGNVYVADQSNFRIRKITSDGTISTVAGDGLLSYSGDGGQAAKAQLDGPQGLGMDSAGNLYIADTQNNAVREVFAGGLMASIAGTGIAGFSGDGGQAAVAQLNKPQGVAVDSTGNLYIADTLNNRVRLVSPAGVIATVAGTGAAGFSGDGGPASNAQLNRPQGLAVDTAGNLYIADVNNSRIRKVSPDGTIHVVAGTGASSYSGDGGPATSAFLNGPEAVAVDSAGNLFIADTGNNRIRLVTPDGNISTSVGTGAPGHTGDGGPAANALIAAPGSVAVDSAGNLYIGDSSTRVRKVSPDGIIVTITGSNSPGYSGDGGLATDAQINGPLGMALDASGGLYVADSGNSAIRLLQPAGPGISIGMVTNSASNLTGPVAPGEAIVVYGSGLGPAQLTQAQPDSSGLIATSLAGTRILFNGVPASVLYTSPNQVGAIVPSPTPVGPASEVIALYLGRASTPIALNVALSAPALFTADSSGQGQAQALNPDGSVNSAATPAQAGGAISLFATGVGQTQSVVCMIGGQMANVQSAAPSLPGVTQISAQIPSGVQAGPSVPVTVQVGAVSSQAGVTIAVSAGQ
jgi:uncharacterized protein (TIGR03437 family)